MREPILLFSHVFDHRLESHSLGHKHDVGFIRIYPSAMAQGARKVLAGLGTYGIRQIHAWTVPGTVSDRYMPGRW